MKFNNPLDNIRIASPCKSDWNQMYGDDRRRFCGECKMNVYNLSEMTRSEAESFLINSEGPLCVQFYRRSDGTVMTKDCPVGWRAIKTRVFRSVSAGVTFIAALFTGLFAVNKSLEINEHQTWKERITAKSSATHSLKVEIPETVPAFYRGAPMLGGAPSDYLQEIRANRKSKPKKRR